MPSPSKLSYDKEDYMIDYSEDHAYLCYLKINSEQNNKYLSVILFLFT